MVLLDRGEFLVGSDDRDGFPWTGRGPVRAVSLRPFWIEPFARLQRPLCLLCGDNRICDRGGALRLVLRLRRPPARRPPARQRSGAGAVVATGLRRELE
jgi:hypothetical protein